MHVLIIGNGIAGITAAITIRKLSDYKVTVIGDESAHFYARTALMYLYLGQLRYENIKPYEDWFWEEQNIQLRQGWINTIDFREKTAFLSTAEKINYDKLIFATGSKVRFSDWPNKHLKGIHGFYNLLDLKGIEQTSVVCKNAVIVGGGLIGVELAEMLHSRGIKVTVLVRDDRYWGKNLPLAEAKLIEKRLTNLGIKVHLKTSVSAFIGAENGSLTGLLTTNNETLPCEFAGITIGVEPNLELAARCDLIVGKGIKVDAFLQTSQPDVYAIGDCAELASEGGKIEQLWYTGRMQGETVAHTICGRPVAYSRGIPFNSAKFFDLELQTYGSVNPEENSLEESLFWQHASGLKSIRLNYLTDAQKTISGFVLIGVRYRQEVCEKWLKEKRSLAYVVQNLKEANFDPEFHRRFEKEIQLAYILKSPETRIPERQRKIFNWFNFKAGK